MLNDPTTFWLVLAVVVTLGVLTAVGWLLRRQANGALDPVIIDQFNRRIVAWWILCAAMATTLLIGQSATVVLFGLISFWALREFITLTPTRIADHKALFAVFFVFTPAQYILVGLEREGLYSILIPVYGFLYVAARIALAGDYKRFLERTAKIQAGLMVCVYCLSYAPAILSLQDPRPESVLDLNQNVRLLFFLVVVVQVGEIVRLAAEKLIGKHLVAPAISQNRSWEGFLGAVGGSLTCGLLLGWAMPFELLMTILLSLVIGVMGFAGGLTMSAIKRDRGVDDYGTLVTGHGGVLDRIDALCFATPVFYQICKYYFWFHLPG